MFKPSFLILSATVCITLFLSGCATLESPYPDKMKTTKQDIYDNNAEKAIKAYTNEFSKSDDPSLYQMELGRINQLNNNDKAALNDYAQAIQTIRNSRLKPTIQVSRTLSSASALATSDLELAYDVPDYEQTFLYAYQAQNYLGLNDLSNALVSIRRLSQAQAWVQKQNEINTQGQKKISDDFSQYNIHPKKISINQTPEIANIKEQVNSIANAYENGFAYYLAAILYEADQYNYNDAFISIKNAFRLLPDNPYVKETYQQMEKGFYGGNPFKKNQGRLVILYESGLVDQKYGFRLTLPLGKLGVQSFSVPYYKDPKKNIQNTLVHVYGNSINLSGKTTLLVDTNLLAAKSLTEQYPAIITRAVLRLIFKSAATYKLGQESDFAGILVGSIYNIITSKADLRSWLLLPKSIQLYESMLPEGSYRISIDKHQQKVDIKSNKTTLVWVTHIGQFFDINVYQL
ncbi:hypothetical protein L3V79_03725 [Thiotrichales bacterium 19S9-12]|nr:hypothetical protein [Thiotrichales bacterium 19S9-11]MCF6811465.1 hypothetical protein [Thiotrichales bacterium 19S9-12]